MKKVVSILIMFTAALAQDIQLFEGSLSFDYVNAWTGGSPGSFNADNSSDTASFAGAFKITNGDTATLIVSSAMQTTSETGDIFLIFYRDTTGNLPTDFDIGLFSTLDPFPSLLYLKDIDSTFLADFVDLLPDSQSIAESDSLDFFPDSLLLQILELALQNAHVPISCNLTFDPWNDDSLSGTFDGTISSGNIFTALSISNGTFHMASVELPQVLHINKTAPPLPKQLSILSISPNPFNSRTKISFAMYEANPINISVIDLSGRLSTPLYDGTKPAGRHSLSWNAENLSSGIYFILFQTPQQLETRKILFLK